MELLRKIQELEAGHAQLQHELLKLKVSSSEEAMVKSESPSRQHQQQYQRSNSVSPQRSRFPQARRKLGGVDGGGYGGWKKSSASFRYASPLQRESSSLEPLKSGGECNGGDKKVAGAVDVIFSNKQYLSILHSMGQAVHIMDIYNIVIYWIPSAEQLYGYSSKEAKGENVVELLADPLHFSSANDITDKE